MATTNDFAQLEEGRGAVHRLSDEISDAAREAKEESEKALEDLRKAMPTAVSEKAKQAMQWGEGAADQTRTFIRRYPLATAFFALMFGALLGRMFLSKKAPTKKRVRA